MTPELALVFAGLFGAWIGSFLNVVIWRVPRGEGLFMLGATMVETADAGPITARAAMELLSAAYTLHPAFAEAEIVATGSGLRPSFPDNIPRLRREGDRIHMNGMYRHGFLMAPVLAMELVRMIGGMNAD